MSTDLVPKGVAFARINAGRPIVDCPAPHCRSAMLLPVGTPFFECGERDCAGRADVVWPEYVLDVIAVLALRPDPVTRNWEPGESVIDLVTENVLHGIFPTQDELSGHRGPLLLVVDDRIVAGHPALGAAR